MRGFSVSVLFSDQLLHQEEHILVVDPAVSVQVTGLKHNVRRNVACQHTRQQNGIPLGDRVITVDVSGVLGNTGKELFPKSFAIAL